MFTVTNRNWALGLFPTMADAVESVRLSDPDAVPTGTRGEWHATLTGARGEYNIVWVRPAQSPGRLHD